MHTLSWENLMGVVDHLRRDPCITRVAQTSRRMNAAYHDGRRRTAAVRCQEGIIEWSYGVLPHRTCDAVVECAPAVALLALRSLAARSRSSRGAIELSCPSAISLVVLDLLRDAVGIDALHLQMNNPVANKEPFKGPYEPTEALAIMSALGEIRSLKELSVSQIYHQCVSKALGRALIRLERLTVLSLKTTNAISHLQLHRLGGLRCLNLQLDAPQLRTHSSYDAWTHAIRIANLQRNLQPHAPQLATHPTYDAWSHEDVVTWFRQLAEGIVGMPGLQVLKIKIVRERGIDYQSFRAADPVFRAIARLIHLQLLDLGGEWVSYSGLRVMLGGDDGGPSRLTTLTLGRSLAGSHATPEEFAVAVDAVRRHTTSLEDLDLTGWQLPALEKRRPTVDLETRVTDALVWQIGTSSHLRSLRLGHCAIGGVSGICRPHISQLAQALRGAPVIELLHLENNDLSADPMGFVDLIDSIGRHDRLTDLNLSANAIGAHAECLAALGTLPPTLMYLDLSSNLITGCCTLVLPSLPRLVKLYA